MCRSGSDGEKQSDSASGEGLRFASSTKAQASERMISSTSTSLAAPSALGAGTRTFRHRLRTSGWVRASRAAARSPAARLNASGVPWRGIARVATCGRVGRAHAKESAGAPSGGGTDSPPPLCLFSEANQQALAPRRAARPRKQGPPDTCRPSRDRPRGGSRRGRLQRQQPAAAPPPPGHQPAPGRPPRTLAAGPRGPRPSAGCASTPASRRRRGRPRRRGGA